MIIKQTLDVLSTESIKHFISALIKLRQTHLILFMNVILYPCAFSKYPYLLGTVQFSYFFFFLPGGVWQHLHLKNPCSLSTNSAYYCHERAYHQIYQFHLEGVVLANAFVSKSELFEDKHSIIQSVAPPPLFLPFSSLSIPYFKAERLRWRFGKKWKTNCSFVSGRRPDTWANSLRILSALQWSYVKVEPESQKEARPWQLLF